MKMRNWETAGTSHDTPAISDHLQQPQLQVPIVQVQTTQVHCGSPQPINCSVAFFVLFMASLFVLFDGAKVP